MAKNKLLKHLQRNYFNVFWESYLLSANYDDSVNKRAQEDQKVQK